MKKTLLAAAITAVVALSYGCKKEDNNVTLPETTNLTATLSVPTGTTSASGAAGTFSGSISQPTQAFSYSVTFSGVQASSVSLDPLSGNDATFSRSILLAGAFPKADSAANAADTTRVASPLSGSVFLSDARADSLRNGLYQLTIRSKTAQTGALTGVIREP